MLVNTIVSSWITPCSECCWIFEGEGRNWTIRRRLPRCKGSNYQSLAQKQAGNPKQCTGTCCNKSRNGQKKSPPLRQVNLQARTWRGFLSVWKSWGGFLEIFRHRLLDASFFTQSHDYTQKVKIGNCPRLKKPRRSI